MVVMDGSNGVFIQLDHRAHGVSYPLLHFRIGSLYSVKFKRLIKCSCINGLYYRWSRFRRLKAMPPSRTTV